MSGTCMNVGMTITCNECDLIDIIWCKTKIAQKSDREKKKEKGEGKGEMRERGAETAKQRQKGRETHRESWALEYGLLEKKKKEKERKTVGGGGGGLTLEKEEGFQFQTSREWLGKLR